ncbi:MAG: hypothetical protein H6953_10960 [Chromatiaceae bacterium]|nr:hypothetical protein [Gammaproteobacteria bacterium]MCP5305952.1 hypothetical protein [Chromatiaceae bacterium]MCP5312812.1 hypothetical protein [Chromatiaceae bacterium]
MPASAELTEGVGIAVAAESLYLVNLLLAPGLGFAALVWLWWSNRGSTPPLAAAHLAQTLSGSVWAGILLVVVNGLILLLGGYQGPHLWVIVIIYFTLFHSMLVMFGAFGLAKAMSGQCWRFPLVGRPLPTACVTR